MSKRTSRHEARKRAEEKDLVRKAKRTGKSINELRKVPKLAKART